MATTKTTTTWSWWKPMDQEHGLGDAAGEKANLRLGNVSNGYGGRTVEDHGLAMSVRRRKIVALCGAGKSTTFNIMVGRGSVSWGLVDTTRPRRARLGIGDLTQESSVFRGLLVHDNNIELVVQETGVSRTQQQVLEEFSLQAIENTMGRALTGGKLAGALASNCAGGPPNVDEPFAGEEEDPMVVAEMRSLDDMGILSTDHNGCAMASGAPAEICQEFYVKKYYLGEGFQRWECSLWSPSYGW